MVVCVQEVIGTLGMCMSVTRIGQCESLLNIAMYHNIIHDIYGMHFVSL